MNAERAAQPALTLSVSITAMICPLSTKSPSATSHSFMYPDTMESPSVGSFCV